MSVRKSPNSFPGSEEPNSELRPWYEAAVKEIESIIDLGGTDPKLKDSIASKFMGAYNRLRMLENLRAEAYFADPRMQVELSSRYLDTAAADVVYEALNRSIETDGSNDDAKV